MTTNAPFKMALQTPDMNSQELVLVYHFFHDGSNDSECQALCWSTVSKKWVTVSIAYLRPVENFSAKRRLTETYKNK